MAELRLDADSKAQLASASGDMAAATEHLKAELDFEHAEKLIGYIDKKTPPEVVKQQAQFRLDVDAKEPESRLVGDDKFLLQCMAGHKPRAAFCDLESARQRHQSRTT